MAIGDELTNVRIDQLIGAMGRGIAEAQYELDVTGMKLAQLMSGLDEADRVKLGGKTYSLLELGFTPTFYQFTQTELEVKIAITITSSNESQTSSTSSNSGLRWDRRGISAYASSVNASYANKYQYTADGSSLMRTTLTPVPAPALLNDRIRALVEEGAAAPKAT